MTVEGEFFINSFPEYLDPQKEYNDARLDMIEATADGVNYVHHGQIESIQRRLTAATEALSQHLSANANMFNMHAPIESGASNVRMHHVEHVSSVHTTGAVRRAARGGRAAQKL